MDNMTNPKIKGKLCYYREQYVWSVDFLRCLLESPRSFKKQTNKKTE